MLTRLIRLLRSVIDPRPWLHVFRLVHYYNYSFVEPSREMLVGSGAVLAPNLSLRNGARITIGPGAHIGTRCSLWAGDATGRISIGAKALFGPEVFITASNYRTAPGVAVMDQPRDERDVVVGADVWLGARV